MQGVGKGILGRRKGDRQGSNGQVLRTVRVANIDAMWGGLGLEGWLRPDPKQDV